MGKIMSNRQVMQQALECIERLNAHGWILADFEDEVESAITSLREALAREHAMHELSRLGQEIEQEPDRRVLQAEGKHPAPCARHCEAKAFEIEIRSLKSRQEPVAMDWQRGSVPLGGNSCSIVSQKTIPFEFRQPAAQQEQEPSQWRDMMVVTLVREGIDKHRARELADHFAITPTPAEYAQGYAEGFNDACKKPEQKPVACRFCHSEKGCWAWQCYTCGEIDDVQKPTPPATQPEQKYEERIAPYSTTLSMLLNTTPPAAQRPWVGLTDEEVQFYALKHRQLVNAHYDSASDTNIITAAFEATVFYETVEQALKERNG